MDMQLEERVMILEERVTALEQAVNILLAGGKDAHILAEYRLIRSRHGVNLTKTEAAKVLGVSRATVYAMIKDGRIRQREADGKISAREIAAYLVETRFKAV